MQSINELINEPRNLAVQGSNPKKVHLTRLAGINDQTIMSRLVILYDYEIGNTGIP
jgi:hypothetical protein